MVAQFKMKIDVKMESVKKCMELQKAIVSLVTEHSLRKQWRFESKIIQPGEIHLGNRVSPCKNPELIIPDKEATRRAASILKEEISSKNVDEE